MKNYFRNTKGELLNLLEHCQKIMKNYPSAVILVGTDSQNTKNKSKYCTAVVFRYSKMGAHYVYQNNNVEKEKDLFKRLFKECELSIEIADFIQNNSPYKVDGIELDYNDFKLTKSSPLVSATKGWVESLGYKAILKSGEMIACKAADHQCRI